MELKKMFLPALSLMVSFSTSAEVVAHFDMEVADGMISEIVSGEKFAVEGNFAPENMPGASGEALRFDGYTSHVKARLGNIIPEGTKSMTVELWAAVPCYPIIEIDTDTKEKTAIATCLDSSAKTGFGFYLGFNGQYSFKTYIGGWPLEVEAAVPLPTYKWNHLVAVIDCDAKSVKLYNNGEEVGTGKASGTLSYKGGDFYIGQATESRMAGPFQLMSYNGLIDDIIVRNEALSLSEIKKAFPENSPSLDIPSTRFSHEILRPAFHGMPAAGWTNECHGLWYSDGKYHLFFQKNADGPYMARLHWGHISSTNLYEWREEDIALAPGEPYDIKGCWSGCIFSDNEITGSLPNILYTAVDYQKATIALAYPESDALVNWTKSASNPIINGRPSGLSDDFRDPYFFRNGENAYIIVGTSQDNVGAATLHHYNPATKTWSNSGDIFFKASSRQVGGRFWEMPNITRMPDGKWLFTVTPLETSQGVRTLFWTGGIDDSGRFVPDVVSSSPRTIELNSRDGFGLLSPTVYSHDGKVIALGIVPDKLPASENWKLGWAHCYSLPREWSLDSKGALLQRPASDLEGLRGDVTYSNTDFYLTGSISTGDVDGRMAELLAEFEVDSAMFGFSFFKGAASEANLTYNPVTGELVADFSNLKRISNDNGVYDGVYRCTLPERPAVGSTMKINLFIDHSILDIFVNDRWATSIRVFPTEANDTAIEAFAEGGSVKVKSLKAWKLSPDTSAVDRIYASESSDNNPVDVYNMSGICIKRGVVPQDALTDLPEGIYIVGGKKKIAK